MKWNFWEKAPKKAAPPTWPTDAYESVKFLAGFFSMTGSLPFREWKSPLVDVKPSLESTVQIAVRGLQTRLYFWLLERRFGVPEAEIARDGFLALLSQLGSGQKDDIGTMTGWLLRLIDEAVKTAEGMGEKTIPTPSGNVAVPLEYFMALHLLMRLPDSPYYNSAADPEFGQDDWALTECLVHGKDAAREFFTPMIDAITQFDVTQFSEWSWRKNPGAYERHLQRRHNSLLFPAARRVVTASEVLEARRKDDAEFRELLEKAKAIELPETLPRNWRDFLDDIRQRIDALKARARQIGGDTTKIMDFLNSTRSSMADVWKACNKDNAEALRLYEIAEAAGRKHDEIFRGDFGNQLLRADACIPPEEVIPALLREDAATVAAFYGMLGDAERTSASQWAAQILKDAEKEGFDILSIREQLYAMGWPRPPVAA